MNQAAHLGIKISAYLPHRDPFLLIHRVEELQVWQTCVACYDIAHDHPVFQGHFPQYPIYPGVLIIESLAQCAGLLLQVSRADDEPNPATADASPCYGLLSSIEKARFYKPVKPGSTLRCVVHMTHKKPPFYFSMTEAFVQDELVAKARISACLQSAEI